MTALGLIALVALGAQPAAARPAPAGARLTTTGGGHLVLEAVDVRYRLKQREWVASSRGAPVVLTRDDAKLTCKELVARTDEAQRISSATCSGDVRFVRGARTLTCDRAVFDGANDRVTCEGNPVLRDAGAEARGARLVYDLREDQVSFQGAPDRPVQVTVPGDELEARRQELERRRKEQRR